MLELILNNIGTICVALALAAIVAMISVKLIKDRKHGKSSCGCNCAHCAAACDCRKDA